MNTHYHYGSGMHGCLYDNGPHYAETLQDAVDYLAFTFGFDDDPKRKNELKHEEYLELDNTEDGAEYCEIIKCNDDCNPDDYE